MKILVLSDSHGVLSYMENAVRKEKPDIAIHLGDCVEDAKRLGRLFPNLRLFSVKGNNDWTGAPIDSVFATDFGKIYMCHGHMLGVKSSVTNLVYKAKSRECNIALYGHTHRPHLEEIDGVTVVNPGASMMLGSYAVCDGGKWELRRLL